MGRARTVEHDEALLLTVVEAAMLLGVGRTTAYELIAAGDLQVVHIGRSARVPRAAVHRYVNALMSPPSRTMRSAPRQRIASQPSLPFIGDSKD